MKMPNKDLVNKIVNKAPINDIPKKDDLNKTQNVSFTIQKRDLVWMDSIIKDLTNISRKRVNKSRLMTAGLILLQQKSKAEILDVLKEI